MLIAMVSAFLLLEERDEGIIAFYQITPAEGYAYLTALPSFWIGKLIFDGTSIFSFMFGLLTCCAWIFFFTRKFISYS